MEDMQDYLLGFDSPELTDTDDYLKSCRGCRFLAVHIDDIQAFIADEPHVTCNKNVFTWMEVWEAAEHTCSYQRQVD